MAGEAAKAAARRRREAWKIWGSVAAALVVLALLCRFLLWRERGFTGTWDVVGFVFMMLNLAGTAYVIGVGAGDEAPVSTGLGGSASGGGGGGGGGLGEMIKDWFYLCGAVLVRGWV